MRRDMRPNPREPMILDDFKSALLKAHKQSSCFFYPSLARAFKSTVLADLFSFGGISQTPCFHFLCRFLGGRKLDSISRAVKSTCM